MNVNKRLVVGFVLLVASIVMLCVATASMAPYMRQNESLVVKDDGYNSATDVLQTATGVFVYQGSQYKVQ